MSANTTREIRAAADVAALDFEKGSGLLTVVTQHAHSGAVLMVAFADREAVERTVASGEMHYRSRMRGAWHKGATSGNVQRVVSLHADCDGDALLALVEPAGPACHTGAVTCFGGALGAPDAFQELNDVVAERAADERGAASSSNTRRLLEDRNLRLKKLGEECGELIVACADGDRGRAAEEGADLVYHMVVALRALGVGLCDVAAVLAARQPAPRD